MIVLQIAARIVIWTGLAIVALFVTVIGGAIQGGKH